MKQRLIALLLLLTVVWLTGCNRESSQEEALQGPVYEPVSTDETLREQLRRPLTDYLLALQHQSYSELLLCAEEDFALCRDETAFYDLTTGIEKATELHIMTDEVMKDNDGFLVRMQYELTRSGSFTDSSGILQPPGTYEYDELFTLKQTDNGFLIADVRETGDG